MSDALPETALNAQTFATCLVCGIERTDSHASGGYIDGALFGCGSEIRFDIAVTNNMQVVRKAIRWEHHTLGCREIERMRPIYEAAMKPGASHFDAFSPEAEALRQVAG